MDNRFRAFSFVNRITAHERGVSIHGEYAIPPEVNAFPASLVAEAVGQLAAWAAMAAVDFSHRPVAGIAGTIELLSQVRPGQVLVLAAELESVDTDTVGYSGTARVDCKPVIRLLDCVGPMVPLDDFDDPLVLRERYGTLCGAGATPGGFPGLSELNLESTESEQGRVMRAILRVPSAAPFFADHFPRRPVFPGTLLMHAHLQVAALLAAEIVSGEGTPWAPRTVSEVKLRSFIPPGEVLSLEARRTECSEGTLSVAVESRMGQRLVGSGDIHFIAQQQL